MALFGGEVRTIPYQSPDYSGSVQAARGLAMAGAQGVAGGISQATDYFKQQGEKKKLIKQSDIQIDAALKLFPDLSPTLQGVRDQIKDENISLDERAGIAESVAGLINMGTNQMQAMADYGLKKRQLDIQEGQGIQSALMEQAKMQAEANKPIKMKPEKAIIDGLEVDVLRDDYGSVYDPQTKSRIIDFPGYVTGKPLEQVTEQFDISGLPAVYSGAIPTDIGMVLPEKQNAGVPVLSREAQAAADIAGAAYPDGIPVEGTPIAPEVAQTPIDKALALTPRGKEISGKGEVVTDEELKKRIESGLSITSTPIGGGRVRITSQTGSPKPSPVIESPESKLQTQRLLELDKSLGSLREAGTTASLDVEPLREITRLLDTNVKTGFGRETLMQAKKILGQDVSNEEQFQARVGAEAMKNIALTKGAISDREMDYFKTVLSPNMGKTTEGNKKIIEFRIKYANRANKIAKTISNLQKNKKDPYEIQEAVDKIISSESLLDNRKSPDAAINQAEADAGFLNTYK